MKKRSKFLLMLFSLLQLNSSLAAYPMGNTTHLPPPAKAFEKEDLPLLGTLLSMTVYPDSKIDKLYYYVPFFRVFQYDQGAGTLLLNSVKANNVFKADMAMNQMQSVEEVVPDHILNNPLVASKQKDVLDAEERLKRWEEKIHKRIEKYQDLISETEAELNIALKENDQRLVDAYQKYIIDKNNDIAKMRQELAGHVEEYNRIKANFDSYKASVIETWRKRRLHGIVTHLASAGLTIDLTQYPTADGLASAINKALNDIKKTNGGSLTMSIYSGFTEKQIRDIRTLKNKYWPDIQVILMPANDLQFTPLAQVEDSLDKPRENIMFKSIRGSGGYHGATVNFDLTVDGAVSLGMALGPFVIPVGVSAVIKDRVEPFKGHVTCKYNNDFWKHGRADVTDGWLIFDNDISNNIKTETNNNANCEVIVEKGNTELIQAEALRKIEENFAKNFFQKTYLTQAEARTYYENTLNDIANHLNKGRDQATWLNYLIPFFGESASIQALSTARESYWHTSKFNTGNADRLNFTHKIDEPGVESIRKDMPALLCLFYNAKKQAYDRCTSEQETHAEGLLVATRRASTSPECKNVKTIYECMTKRTESALELKPQKEEKVVDNLLQI